MLIMRLIIKIKKVFFYILIVIVEVITIETYIQTGMAANDNTTHVTGLESCCRVYINYVL